jgi:hypothetical protein
MCNDGIIRCCFIRNKFKTYGKRENTVSVGIWILAGIRLWESRTSGVQKCDLLEVYSQTEKDRLKQTETCSFQNLLNAIEADRTVKGGVDFSTIQDDLFEKESQDETDSSDDEGIKKNSAGASSSAGANKVGASSKKTLKDLMKTTPIKNDDTDWLNEQIDVRNI